MSPQLAFTPHARDWFARLHADARQTFKSANGDPEAFRRELLVLRQLEDRGPGVPVAFRYDHPVTSDGQGWFTVEFVCGRTELLFTARVEGVAGFYTWSLTALLSNELTEALHHTGTTVNVGVLGRTAIQTTAGTT